MSSRDRRARREQPYLGQHLDREAERKRAPRTFGELLRWFLEGFWAETPEAIHAAGVWSTTRRLDARARPTEDVPPEQQGGSALGAPKYAEPFRQLLENSARQTSDDNGTTDPYFVRPMRAAIAKLGGGNDGTDSAFMARFLLQVAYAAGDWQAVGERWDMQPFVVRPYTETALRRLHRCWRVDPPIALPSWIDRSDSQRAAEEAEPNGNGAAA